MVAEAQIAMVEAWKDAVEECRLERDVDVDADEEADLAVEETYRFRAGNQALVLPEAEIQVGGEAGEVVAAEGGQRGFHLLREIASWCPRSSPTRMIIEER